MFGALVYAAHYTHVFRHILYMYTIHRYVVLFYVYESCANGKSNDQRCSEYTALVLRVHATPGRMQSLCNRVLQCTVCILLSMCVALRFAHSRRLESAYRAGFACLRGFYVCRGMEIDPRNGEGYALLRTKYRHTHKQIIYQTNIQNDVLKGLRNCSMRLYSQIPTVVEVKKKKTVHKHRRI